VGAGPEEARKYDCVLMRMGNRGVLYFKYIHRILRIHSIAIEINM